MDLLKNQKNIKQPFSLSIWRDILFSNLLSNKRKYIPNEIYAETFKKWQIYNYDSIFVYALESALSGFLQFLHSNNNSFSENAVITFLNRYFNKIQANLDKNISFLNPKDDCSQIINKLKNIKSSKLLDIKSIIIHNIQNESGLNKIIYSFYLYIFIQSTFNLKFTDKHYSKAIDFYITNSNLDGRELSLIDGFEILKNRNQSMIDFFIEIFLNKWVIQKQLEIRHFRQKNVSWFHYNKETETFNWESDYTPILYRASRIDILLSFLENIDIVDKTNNSEWELLADF